MTDAKREELGRLAYESADSLPPWDDQTEDCKELSRIEAEAVYRRALADAAAIARQHPASESIAERIEALG